MAEKKVSAKEIEEKALQQQDQESTEVEVLDEENVYRLLKPIDGLPDRFIFDMESLQGDDIIKAERRFNAEANRTRNVMAAAMPKELSKEYLSVLVAMAIGWKPEDVRMMGAKDFNILTIRAQNFLTNM